MRYLASIWIFVIYITFVTSSIIRIPVISGVSKDVIDSKNIISGKKYVSADDKLPIVVQYSKLRRHFLSKLFRNYRKPLILLIHGSGAGGWVYNEHWLRYFAKSGYDTFAISLRGSYDTGMRTGDNSTFVKVSQHISDVTKVVQKLRNQYSNKSPVIVLGHSFGGYLLTEILENKKSRELIDGAAWMCALPPTGQGPMVKRFLFTRFTNTVNILRSFAFDKASTNIALKKKLFFDDQISYEDVKKYISRLKLDAVIQQDMTFIEDSSKKRIPLIKKGAIAPWLLEKDNKHKVIYKDRINRLVLGSNDDYIVDPPAIIETAKYYDTKPILVNGPGHNIMLGEKWEVAAKLIVDWVDSMAK